MSHFHNTAPFLSYRLIRSLLKRTKVGPTRLVLPVLMSKWLVQPYGFIIFRIKTLFETKINSPHPAEFTCQPFGRESCLHSIWLCLFANFTFISVPVVNTLKCGELAFRCGLVINSFSFMK